MELQPFTDYMLGHAARCEGLPPRPDAEVCWNLGWRDAGQSLEMRKGEAAYRQDGPFDLGKPWEWRFSWYAVRGSFAAVPRSAAALERDRRDAVLQLYVLGLETQTRGESDDETQPSAWRLGWQDGEMAQDAGFLAGMDAYQKHGARGFDREQSAEWRRGFHAAAFALAASA